MSVLAVARRVYPRPQDLEPIEGAEPPGGQNRMFRIYLVAAAMVAAGFADFPLMAYHFQRTGNVSVTYTPMFYAAAMAVSGTGSLVCGRLFDRFGIRLLIPLTMIAALYAPLVYLGGFWPALIGSCLWGLGVGVHESIIPAVVAPMVGSSRRAGAFGTLTGVYGVAWFAGSAAIGALFGVSMAAVVVFSAVVELLAIPLLVLVARGTDHPRSVDQGSSGDN